MAEQRLPQVFISYSRKDPVLAKYVAELAANLHKSGFYPWVDTTRLEVGVQWERMIQEAINNSIAFILIMTPEAAKSAFVFDEITYARDMKKYIIPLLYSPLKPVDFRLMSWRSYQYLDMQNHNDQDFKKVVKVLLRVSNMHEGISASSPDIKHSGVFSRLQKLWSVRSRNPVEPYVMPKLSSEEIRHLRIEARSAESAGDINRAARLWEELLNASPNDRDAQNRLKDLQPSLNKLRISEFMQSIKSAQKIGDWRQEYALWEKLVAFRKLEPEEIARRDQAAHNQTYQEEYGILEDLVKRWSSESNVSDVNKAKQHTDQRERYISDLRKLWSNARYYGDPAGLAHKLGIRTQEEEESEQKKKKAEEEALAAQAREEAERKRKLQEIREKASLAVTNAIASVNASDTAVSTASLALSDVAQTTKDLEQFKAFKKRKLPNISEIEEAIPQATAAMRDAESAAATAKKAMQRAAESASKTQFSTMLDDANAAAQSTELASREAQAAEKDAVDASLKAISIKQALNRVIDELQHSQNLHKPIYFIKHVFPNSGPLGMSLVSAFMFIGTGSLVGIISQSLNYTLTVVGIFAILGFFLGYQRVVRRHMYLFNILIAGGISGSFAKIASWTSVHLAPPPLRIFWLFGFGPFQLSNGNIGTFVFSNGIVWAIFFGVIGFIIGVIAGASEEQLLIGILLGSVFGSAIGFTLGMLLSFAVTNLGWLYSGIMIGGLVSLIASSFLLQYASSFGATASAITIFLAFFSLMISIIFTRAFGLPLTDSLSWCTGLIASGLTGIGTVALIIIVLAVHEQHPLHE